MNMMTVINYNKMCNAPQKLFVNIKLPPITMIWMIAFMVDYTHEKPILGHTKINDNDDIF